MSEYRVVALGQDTVDRVRTSLRAPGYGHPAHVEIAAGYGPCRLCLETFRQGAEERVLFTYNPFPASAVPSPGPVFVHKESCSRYEGPGVPAGLLELPLFLEGYEESGLPVVRTTVARDPDRAVQRVLSTERVAFAHIRNAEAGCFIARIERLDPGAM